MYVYLVVAAWSGRPALTQAIDVVAAESSISGRYGVTGGPLICLSREIHSNGRCILHGMTSEVFGAI